MDIYLSLGYGLMIIGFTLLGVAYIRFRDKCLGGSSWDEYPEDVLATVGAILFATGAVIGLVLIF